MFTRFTDMVTKFSSHWYSLALEFFTSTARLSGAAFTHSVAMGLPIKHFALLEPNNSSSLIIYAYQFAFYRFWRLVDQFQIRSVALAPKKVWLLFEKILSWRAKSTMEQNILSSKYHRLPDFRPFKRPTRSHYLGLKTHRSITRNK